VEISTGRFENESIEDAVSGVKAPVSKIIEVRNP